MTGALIKRGVLVLAIAAVIAVVGGIVYSGILALCYPDTYPEPPNYVGICMLLANIAVSCALGFFFIAQKAFKERQWYIKTLFFLLTSIITYFLIGSLLRNIAQYFWIFVFDRSLHYIV